MEVINAIGRRKSAVARVYLSEGTGKITINKKDIETYFPSAILRYVVKQPLQLLEAEGKYVSISFLLIVILPVPSERYTRATALLRRPIALITSILP